MQPRTQFMISRVKRAICINRGGKDGKDWCFGQLTWVIIMFTWWTKNYTLYLLCNKKGAWLVQQDRILCSMRIPHQEAKQNSVDWETRGTFWIILVPKCVFLHGFFIKFCGSSCCPQTRTRLPWQKTSPEERCILGLPERNTCGRDVVFVGPGATGCNLAVALGSGTCEASFSWS